MMKIYFSPDGRALYEYDDEIKGMHDPVQCLHCGKVYDLGTVHVIRRHADCSVWKTPCCRTEADDRTWLTRHYERITRR